MPGFPGTCTGSASDPGAEALGELQGLGMVRRNFFPYLWLRHNLGKKNPRIVT